LLAAVELAESGPVILVPAVVGFLMGGGFLAVVMLPICIP
jgi:hypothetical protein